ncbi:MAG: hypothetical protein RL414_55 [Actinomycetota bacterium]
MLLGAFLILVFPFSSTAVAAGSLGITAQVLQSQDSNTSIGANSSLWYLIKPGGTSVRQIQVKSLANIPMRVSTKVGYGFYLNGIAEFDESKKSKISKWISFTDPTFVLNPGATRVITMKMSVPSDSEIGTDVATLFINGSPATASKQTSKYAVTGSARIAISMFIGVGTMAQIATSFTIDKTSIFNEQGNRFASIRVSNNGKTPVAPSGTIYIQNQAGDIKISKPLILYSKTLVPGESGVITVRIPSNIPNGKWIFNESLSQGAFVQTKAANVSLTSPSIFTKTNGIRLLVFIASILLMAFALKRRSKEKIVVEKDMELLDEPFDIEAFLAELKEVPIRPRKKAPAKKKATSKKAPAKKKAPVKKTVAKKATARR